MKHTVFLFFISSFFICCHAQPGKETARKQKALLESIEPGTIPAKTGSWTMTAVLNGKPWTASSLMLPDAAGRVIGYYGGGFISLPYFRTSIKEGKKIAFSETKVVDFWKGEGHKVEAGEEGGMELTKVDGDWVEGVFHFTVKQQDDGSLISVTNGFFRISTAKHP